MFIEFFYHLLTLDFVWIVQLILNNLHYSFAFLSLAAIFLGKKSFAKIFLASFVIVIELWAYSEFSYVIGWSFLAGGFLLLFYASRFLVLVFAEEHPFLRKKLVPLMLAQFLITFIIYNLFVM